MTNEILVFGLEQAAKELRLSVSMLRILADRGALPSFRDSSRRRMFLPCDVAAYAKKRETKATQAVQKKSRKLRLRSK